MSEKTVEKVGAKKLRIAERMGKKDELDPSHSGKKKGQRYNPEDRFSAKEVKKENAAYKEENGRLPKHSWET